MDSTSTKREYNLGEQGYGSDLAENFCKLLEALTGTGSSLRLGYFEANRHEVGKSGSRYTLVRLIGGQREEIGTVEDGNGYSDFVLWANFTGDKPVYGFKEVLTAFVRRYGHYYVTFEEQRSDNGAHGIRSLCWDVRYAGKWLAHVFTSDDQATDPEVKTIVLEPETVANMTPTDETKHCLEKGRIGYCWHLATMLPHLQEAGA